MLKPAGTLSFAVGNLSTAAAIGGGATGASLAAASLSAGRPIKGEPGGSAGAAGCAAAAGGLAGCCAAAPKLNIPIKAPASTRLRGANEQIVMTSSPERKPYVLAPVTMPALVALPRGSLRYFSVGTQLEILWKDVWRQCFVTGSSDMSRIASAKGNSSTTSPSSSVTSRIALKRLRSAPSVFSSSRIIARATSHARSRSRSSSPSGSETSSSPICVLKKNRGIAQNPSIEGSSLNRGEISRVLYPRFAAARRAEVCIRVDESHSERFDPPLF